MQTSYLTADSLRRLRAVAILRLGSVNLLHKALPICPRAFSYQLKRGALTESVRQALIAQLGADGLRFVLGEIDTLRDVRADHAA